MHDVTRQPSEAKRQLAAKVDQAADSDEHYAGDQQQTAEFPRGFHSTILRRLSLCVYRWDGAG